MQPVIRVENLHHVYHPDGGSPVYALSGVDLAVMPGEYVVILGANGSGKSTLAKHLNALLLPNAPAGEDNAASGNVWVKAWNTRDVDQHLNIRATVGMVFQVPDNQIVATVVEEDVAFGPENLGVPRDEILRRVDWALDRVEMLPFRQRPPHQLSGGQKQRICIAGVLAMQPDVLVLDESTAMLDPLGRQEVLATVHRLNREEGVTVIAITHFMEEALNADRVIVMNEGRVVLHGTPRELFRQPDRLRALELDVPPVAQVAHALHERDATFPIDRLTIAELVDAIAERGVVRTHPLARDASAAPGERAPLIAVRDLVHDYMRDTPMEVRALHGIDMEVRPREIVGVIGHTGSGKSTLLQHLNALMRPQSGEVLILGHSARDPSVDVRALRQAVGLVFQFAEAQLFERYVGDDIAYGPRNLGLNREAVRARVQRAMERVDLGFEAFKDRMTFDLSGGEMRRVALAGVLALEPAVLVLDEPTAGLDPQGRAQLMRQILALRGANGEEDPVGNEEMKRQAGKRDEDEASMALVLVSHNMDELAAVCDRLYVIAEGRTVLHGTPRQVFAQGDRLRALGLDVPTATAIFEALCARDVLDERTLPPVTVEEIVQLLSGASIGA